MIIQVPLDSIDDNPFQRRKEYGDVEGLAADIRERGLLQIPRGRLIGGDGQAVTETGVNILHAAIDQRGGFPAGYRVQLAFGHRRFRAYQHNAKSETPDTGSMPVYIEAMSDDDMLDVVWAENHHRRDINPIEQAELLAEKLERARSAGGSQSTVAVEWGLDRSTIANKLRLLELPTVVQDSLREQRLSERQALALLPVVELAQKLAGAATVRWQDDYASWLPPDPAAFIAEAIQNPDDATSDAIRQYTKQALKHAGQVLSDALAVFEAGTDTNIVQSSCKGCQQRQNQYCLNSACYDARAERFVAAWPTMAARETGLPYSDDAADFVDMSEEEVKKFRADWEDGRHDDLVVGIVLDRYYKVRPFSELGYVSGHSAAGGEDWRRAIVIGRKAGTLPEVMMSAGDSPTRPSTEELENWRKLSSKGDRERIKRTQQALLRNIRPLAEDETAMRALMAMLDQNWLESADDAHRTPSSDEFAEKLFAVAWQHARTYSHYSLNNRGLLRLLLHRAAINPDIVDPPDPTLRLLDIGQAALLAHDFQRSYGLVASDERRRLVREALSEFDSASSVVARNRELTQLDAYLRATVEYEDGLVAAELEAIEKRSSVSEAAGGN